VKRVALKFGQNRIKGYVDMSDGDDEADDRKRLVRKPGEGTKAPSVLVFFSI
jgi:hypothetical protein